MSVTPFWSYLSRPKANSATKPPRIKPEQRTAKMNEWYSRSMYVTTLAIETYHVEHGANKFQENNHPEDGNGELSHGRSSLPGIQQSARAQ
jgi:hypothetical protein